MSRDPFLEGELLDADVAWEPWTPEEVARRLSGTGALCYVVAGWALDLFIGRQPRPHDDIEIGVPARRFSAIRMAFDEYNFDVVDSGRRWPLSSGTFGSTFKLGSATPTLASTVST
jgi:hypothetical protein